MLLFACSSCESIVKANAAVTFLCTPLHPFPLLFTSCVLCSRAPAYGYSRKEVQITPMTLFFSKDLRHCWTCYKAAVDAGAAEQNR